MTSTTLRVARTVLAMQQFSCYVTLKEANKAINSALGEEINSQSVREMLNTLADAGLVHRIGGGVGSGSNEKQYCWVGPGDLQDMQEVAAKRVATPLAAMTLEQIQESFPRITAPLATAKECARQIAEARTLPVLEVVPEGGFEFHTIDPASIKWTGPGTYVSLTPDAPPTPTRRGRSRGRTAEQITQAIADAGGNKDKAATALGMSRSGLYAAISALGITIKGKMGRPKASVQAAIPPTPPARRGKWSRKPLCTIEQAVAAVRACDGNKKAASEMLNVSEPTLYKYLKLSGVVFERNKRNRRDKRKAAAVGMPQRSRKPAISPPPPACVVKPAEPPRPAREQKPRIHAAEMLTAMHVDALWLLYKSDINNEEVRNELVARYYYLVKNNAFKLTEKLPDCAISAEEFYAPGVHGLIQAMEGFDLDRGLKFPTYAVRRIIGEMKDELRKLDWVPRLIRAGNTKIAKLTQKLDAVPTAEQLAAEYGCDVAAGQRMLDEKVVKCSSYFQNATGEHDAGEFGANWTTGEQVTSISDRKAVAPSRRLSDLDDLRAITKGLNQNERLIIILYYYENQTMKEIGEQLLLSESRVSQMHSDMLRRLRARLADSGRLAC